MTGRPRSFDERRVLEAARDQFWERGYTATSLDDLMRVTGLGKGSLYAAFGDKRGLFLKVLDAYAAWRLEVMRAALGGGEPAIERLRRTLALDGVAEPEPGLGGLRGCMLVNSTSELASHDPEVRERARQTFAALEDLFVEVVYEARDAGDLPEDTDPRTLGRLLLAILQGQEFLAKTGMAPEALAGIGRAAAARLLEGPRGRAPRKARGAGRKGP